MSNNWKIYEQAFKEGLNINESIDLETFKYRDYSWDSVAHMILISMLEDAFNIQLETDDVIDFNSYVKGKEILLKYGVTIER